MSVAGGGRCRSTPGYWGFDPCRDRRYGRCSSASLEAGARLSAAGALIAPGSKAIGLLSHPQLSRSQSAPIQSLPSTIYDLPSAICHLPSCHLPSAICHLPSAICHRATEKLAKKTGGIRGRVAATSGREVSGDLLVRMAVAAGWCPGGGAALFRRGKRSTRWHPIICRTAS